MKSVCPQLHPPGQLVHPNTGLESSLVLSWAARSQELLQVLSKLRLGSNATDWAAAGVTGRLFQESRLGQEEVLDVVQLLDVPGMMLGTWMFLSTWTSGAWESWMGCRA